MLLPAIVEDGIVKEKGLVLYMDESVYQDRPVVNEKDFMQLNRENASTVANIANHMLDYLEKRFCEENRHYSMKIDELSSALSIKEKELDECEAEVQKNTAAIEEKINGSVS